MSVLLAIGSFLMSSVGRYVLIAAVIGAFVVGIEVHGYNRAMRACDAATKQRAMEIMQKDIKIGELLAKEDARLSTEQTKSEDIDREVQKKLEDQLAKLPLNQRCPATANDLKQLRP